MKNLKEKLKLIYNLFKLDNNKLNKVYHLSNLNNIENLDLRNDNINHIIDLSKLKKSELNWKIIQEEKKNLQAFINATDNLTVIWSDEKFKKELIKHKLHKSHQIIDKNIFSYLLKSIYPYPNLEEYFIDREKLFSIYSIIVNREINHSDIDLFKYENGTKQSLYDENIKQSNIDDIKEFIKELNANYIYKDEIKFYKVELFKKFKIFIYDNSSISNYIIVTYWIDDNE